MFSGGFYISGHAFAAGSLNVLYQIERLPLMAAILIHGLGLYASYLCTYLVNDWLQWGRAPVLIFSVIFVACYLLVWLVIYFLTKRNTKKLNKMLAEKQQNSEEAAQ